MAPRRLFQPFLMAKDKSETRLTPVTNLIALRMIFAVDLSLAILAGLVFRDHKSMRSLSPDFEGSNRIGLPSCFGRTRRISRTVAPRMPCRRSDSQESFLSIRFENLRAVAKANCRGR